MHPQNLKALTCYLECSALHVFDFITEELIVGRKPGSLHTETSLETVNQAQCFNYAEKQKEIATEVSNNFTTVTCYICILG